MNGYVQVYTGDGKGKTTAALGLALRAVGAGLQVYMAQFMKKGHYNEIKALSRYGDQIHWEQFGTGRFVGKRPEDIDRELAATGLAAIARNLRAGDHDLVIADEINVAAHLGLIAIGDILNLMTDRPAHVELVLTGRYAPAEVIARADLVTEMKAVKHYYQQGVAARDGVEK